ncbi:hypothetical protein LPJ64_002649 [Coemansia asiatica]|uniref:Uncharacterized protein n=1 Tax=Coemansia asiatica TaxID=1052880 RepID=A0A9W7XMK4_9FUNG|nr:hypothetical protein LPJ64_002649 [Coemansia asiatica]
MRSERKKRRRLFSRRELRHQGTTIVRVGSANVLQKNRGPYSFASVDNRYKTTESSQEAEEVSQDVFPDREPIESFAESSIEQQQQRMDDEEKEPDNGNIGSVRRVTSVANLASRRLKLSPNRTNRKSVLCMVEDILPSSSPLKLPPPLNLDQGILSFPETPPSSGVSARSARPVALARHSPTDIAARLAQSSSSKNNSSSRRGSFSPSKSRLRPSQLTPLRLVKDRLKPARQHTRSAQLPPPVFDIDGLKRRTRASGVSKRSFVL